MIKLQIWWNKGLKKWRIILCSGIAKANTVKMSVFLTWCTTLKQSLLKSQGSYFVDIDRLSYSTTDRYGGQRPALLLSVTIYSKRSGTDLEFYTQSIKQVNEDIFRQCKVKTFTSRVPYSKSFWEMNKKAANQERGTYDIEETGAQTQVMRNKKEFPE